MRNYYPSGMRRRPFQTRGQTFSVSEGQLPSDSVLRIHGSMNHKVCPRFEMVSFSIDKHKNHIFALHHSYKAS